VSWELKGEFQFEQRTADLEIAQAVLQAKKREFKPRALSVELTMDEWNKAIAVLKPQLQGSGHNEGQAFCLPYSAVTYFCRSLQGNWGYGQRQCAVKRGDSWIISAPNTIVALASPEGPFWNNLNQTPMW